MYLAQLNIAKAKADLTSEIMKEFVDNLDPINALADASKGFIWRLKDDTDDANQFSLDADPLMIVNMSIWTDIDSLKNFLFKTHHLSFFKRKSLWFNKSHENSYVLWWIREGHIPDLDEANERLHHLRQHGDSRHAFSFKKTYPENND